MKESVTCNLCSGTMKLYEGPRFNTTLGKWLVFGGIFCCLFWVGVILGLPLIIIGAYLNRARREMWVCTDCMVGVERVRIESDTGSLAR